MQVIESPHVDWARESAQGPFPAQIEIHVEITQRQFAQRPIYGLSIAASGVIRFRQRTPVSIDLIDGNHMVRIVLGFEIENQRRIPNGP